MRRRLHVEFLELRQMLAADPLVFDQNQTDWFSNEDSTLQGWRDLVDDRGDEFIPTDIETDVVGNQILYGATWQRNVINRPWEYRFNLDGASFNNEWNLLNDLGYRLVDQETVVQNGQRLYSGLWIRNVEQYSWASFTDLTLDQFVMQIDDMSNNFLPIDIEAYESQGQTLISVVWVQNVTNRSWQIFAELTHSDFEDRLDEFEEFNRVLEIESYLRNGQERFAAIWIDNAPGRAWAYRYGMTNAEWMDHYTEFSNRNFRLIDYETYFDPIGTRLYSGVWRQNGELVEDDSFEDNDEFDMAAPLSSVSDNMWEESALIQGDDDYFSFDLIEISDVRIDVLFAHVEGNIDFDLLDSGGELIVRSDSMADNESIESEIPLLAGSYVVYVYGPDLATEYELNIAATPTMDDIYEPNDDLTMATEAMLGSDNMWHKMGLIQRNDDFFRFELAEESDVQIEALFMHADGNVDFEVLDSNGGLIARLDTMTDDETYQSILETGTYFVRIDGRDLGTEYDLSITAAPTSVDIDDIYEPNDEFNMAAAVTLGSDNMWQGTELIQGNADYYTFVLASDSNVQFDLLFSNSDGDLKFDLLDSSGDTITTVDSTTDDETYQSTLAAGTYGVHIYGPDLGTQYELNITATPTTTFSYHNEANPADTTNDGFIAPNDVIVIINYLLANPDGALPPLTGPPKFFYDANDDGVVSGTDANFVITRINNNLAPLSGGVGRTSLAVPASPSGTFGATRGGETSDVVDEYWAYRWWQEN